MNFKIVSSFCYCLTSFVLLLFCPFVSYSDTNREQIPFRFQEDRKALMGYEWALDLNVLEQLVLLNRNLHPIRSYEGDTKNIITILQGEYGILRRDRDAGLVLSSFGAGPCIILIIYDQQMGTVALGHFDVYTMVENSISDILKGFVGSERRYIKAKIFSAAADNKLMKKTLSSLHFNQIEVTEFSRQMNIAVSTHGELFDYNITHPEVVTNLSQRQETLTRLLEKSSALFDELVRQGEFTSGQTIMDRLADEFQRLLIRIK